MSTNLEEWGPTTDAIEPNIVNRSKRDVEDKNLNLHH